MAVVKSMNFIRGRLGDFGFRQQYVKNGSNGYKRRTVAFQIPDSVTNPNTPGQVRQRTRFRLVQALGSALARKSILYNFYQSPSGISGYNAFIRDNLSLALVGTDGGDVYVDFRKLQVTSGDFYKKVMAYQSELIPDDCHVAKRLAWNYDWTCDPAGTYALNLIGIKIDESGAVEDIICVQPRTPMHACMADVMLPTCDCCKTYWYAYFVDPYSGYYSTTSYIGTSNCELEEFKDDCYTCNLPESLSAPIVLPPEECPIGCGEGDVDTGAIVFTGDSKVNSNQALTTGVIFAACPLYDWQVVANDAGDGLIIDFVNTDEVANISVMDENGVELYSGADNHIEITGLTTLPTSVKALVVSTDVRCNKELVYEISTGQPATPPSTDNAPTVTITMPTDGEILNTAGIQVAATANDIEDGDLTLEVEWSSDVDGVLTPDANGIIDLSPGVHTLIASVRDADDNIATDKITITAQ